MTGRSWGLPRDAITLPRHHRDPFDQLPITEQAVLVSEDRHAALYKVQVLRCTG